MFSRPSPAYGPISFFSRSITQIWWCPAIATNSVSPSRQQVPRAVQPDRPSPAPARSTAAVSVHSCSPVPATVVTVLAFRSSARIAVVLAVGDVERVARRAPCPAGRRTGPRRTPRPCTPGLPVAGDRDLLAVQVGDDDPVVGAVGDEQPLALRVGQHLAGEEQRRVPPSRGSGPGRTGSASRRASSSPCGPRPACRSPGRAPRSSPRRRSCPTSFPSGSISTNVGQASTP